MPYTTEKIALANQFLDRRIKLLDCQKERVKAMYEEGVSITTLSKIFKVNKRLIQFLLFPERKELNKKQRAARGGSLVYYDREKNNISQNDHRKYKHETLKSTIKKKK